MKMQASLMILAAGVFFSQTADARKSGRSFRAMSRLSQVKPVKHLRTKPSRVLSTMTSRSKTKLVKPAVVRQNIKYQGGFYDSRGQFRAYGGDNREELRKNYLKSLFDSKTTRPKHHSMFKNGQRTVTPSF